MHEATYASSQAASAGVGVGGPLLAALWAQANEAPWWAPLLLGSSAVIVPIVQSFLSHNKLVSELRHEIRELKWELKALRSRYHVPESDDDTPAHKPDEPQADVPNV
jgi:hypothetical protein